MLGSLPPRIGLTETRSPLEKRRRLRQKRQRRSAALFIVSAVLLVGGLMLTRKNEQPEKDDQATAESSPQATRLASVSTATPSPTPAASPILLDKAKQAVDDIVKANPHLIIGVSLVDLANGQRADVGGSHAFTAASTAKIIAATDFLQQVEKGTYSLSQKLGNGTAKYQLQQMINQSNNDSWDLFNDLLGLPNEETFAHGVGLSSYDSSTNSLSSNDMATLLLKLYNGTLLNKDNTALLLSYMQKTNEESLIPAALPKGTKAYHKYGEYEDNVHDAAIVSDGKHLYILTIYTNGKGFYKYDERTETIHQIVKAVTS
ncbi:MAG: serine hydrolase [bacterium]